jgi:hypothetical protein
VFVIPALTTLISLVFGAQVLAQYSARRRSHQLAWGLALLFYAVAAFPEVVGSINGWSDAEFRVYYLFGGILLVPWLALGTAELLLQGPRTRPLLLGWRGFVVVVTVVGALAVALASLHAHYLAGAGTRVPDSCAMWCTPKTETGYGLSNGLAVLSAALGNSLGSVVLVGGALYSAYRTFRSTAPREIPAGNLLIAVGAFTVAGASTLYRLFSIYELFYAGQAAGIVIIFSGFLLIGSVAQVRNQQPLSG